MNKQFKWLLFGGAFLFMTLHAYSQVVDAGDDIFQCAGPVTLNATVANVVSSNNYSVTQLGAFTPEAIGGTMVTLSDDAVSAALPIGFTFCYFNNTYTQFYIGSNGWVSFSPSQPTNYVAASIPSSASGVPKNCVMGPWQDWHPGVSGGPYISYQTIGTAPFRKLVVTWNQCPMFSCTTTKGKFQIVLNESTNTIENHIWTKPSCNTWPGASPNYSVQGLHNSNGTVAVTVPGRNNLSWTANNESWQYTPAGTPTVTWSIAGGANVGSGNTLSVNTNGSIDYVATVQVCGGGSFTDTIHVELTGVQIDFSATNSSIVASGCDVGMGAINLALTNGVGPYSYAWEGYPGVNVPNPTGLSDGPVSVTVTDLTTNCQVSGDFNIPQINTLNVSAQVIPVTCPGLGNGQATANVTGASGGLQVTYEWNDPLNQDSQVASNLQAGIYQLLVTDAAGCHDSINVVITEPPAINIEVLTMEDVTCFDGENGSISVLASGGPNNSIFSYNWSVLGGSTFASGASASNLAAQTYVITASYTNAAGQVCSNPDTLTINEPLPMVIHMIPTNIGCSGGAFGSLEANVTFAPGPYDFVWTNFPAETDSVLNGVIAGTYTVTVTDANGCQKTQSGTISQTPNSLTLGSSVQNVACFGQSNGSATVTVSGGSPNYEYLWNDNNAQTTQTATGLPAGTYTVQVSDANNCIMTLENIVVPEPTALSVSIENTSNPSCYNSQDGLAEANIAGGSPDYTIVWNNNEQTQTATNLSSGTISVTVTDNAGCQATDSDVLQNPSQVNATVSTTEPTCFGLSNGQGIVTPSGGAGNYSILWSSSNESTTNASLLEAGDQSVSVTDGNGCAYSINFTLNQPSELIVNVSTTDDTCGDLAATGSATANASGGTPAYNFSWNGQSGNNSLTNLNDGTYNVIVTDSHDCQASSSGVVGVTNYPVLDISATSLTGYIPLTVQFIDNSLNGQSTIWNHADSVTVNVPTGTSVDLNFLDLGFDSVWVTVVGPGGCKDSMVLPIMVFDSANVAAFNVFTPNGDGENDIYRVACENYLGGIYYDCGPFTVKDFQGIIYNRWGTVVFEWNDVNGGWNGKIEGADAAEGEYIFLGKIDYFDGNHQEFNQWLRLSR
jgi:gliding motility-associated-like protein